MLDVAIAIAAKAFEGKFDKGGQPYILHCLHVMNQMDQTDHELMSIAVLHDLVEDCRDYTFETLRMLGFSERVVDGIKALTHEDGVPYMDYIKIIAMNPDAREVKIADLDHNSRILRMKGLRKKDFERLEKYHTAYAYLKDYNEMPRQYSLCKCVTDLTEVLASHFIDDMFIYLGEIPNMGGHCVVAGHTSGRIYSGYHIENFEEIDDEDV